MTALPANARLCHRCGEHYIGRTCPKCPPALACAPPAAPVVQCVVDVPNDSYDNHTDRAGKAAKLERNFGNGPLAKSEAEKGNPERVLVRVTSVRKRLIDEDNLAEKYHVDCCRYAGLIHGDEPSKTKIEVCQRKAAKDEAEHTIIEITTP